MREELGPRILAVLTHRLRTDHQLASRVGADVNEVREVLRRLQAAGLVRLEQKQVMVEAAITKAGRAMQ